MTLTVMMMLMMHRQARRQPAPLPVAVQNAGMVAERQEACHFRMGSACTLAPRSTQDIVIVARGPTTRLATALIAADVQQAHIFMQPMAATHALLITNLSAILQLARQASPSQALSTVGVGPTARANGVGRKLVASLTARSSTLAPVVSHGHYPGMHTAAFAKSSLLCRQRPRQQLQHIPQAAQLHANFQRAWRVARIMEACRSRVTSAFIIAHESFLVNGIVELEANTPVTAVWNALDVPRASTYMPLMAVFLVPQAMLPSLIPMIARRSLRR
mmetsp:Transcript_149122/g.285782  ORF Transcript_149122/g.285782 Transcript_149122/m.285782 type:complete len:274 (+) Transcript_149122:519-1340(+)